MPVIYWHMHCLFEQADGVFKVLLREGPPCRSCSELGLPVLRRTAAAAQSALGKIRPADRSRQCPLPQFASGFFSFKKKLILLSQYIDSSFTTSTRLFGESTVNIVAIVVFRLVAKILNNSKCTRDFRSLRNCLFYYHDISALRISNMTLFQLFASV